MKHSINKFVIALIISIFVICFICNARNYNVTDANVECVAIDPDTMSPIECWIGWKEWHFGATTPKSKKGDPIIFKKPYIIQEEGTYGYRITQAITNGYGHYALDFSKHILGLLAYLKDKIKDDYQTTYVPIYDQPEFDERGYLKEPEALKIKDALDVTIGKLLRTGYSGEYEKNEFSSFWDKGIKLGDETNLKELQNEFYWNAYGEEAFKVLKKMMGSSYTKLTLKQQRTLKGVLFSVMEARYRNKNVQGKINLKIKAAEGDILPFLVNLGNLDYIVREGSDGHYRYRDTINGYSYYMFPEFDELIDGVYLWMEYYDKDIIASTTHRTFSESIDVTTEEEEIEADWEAEYHDLTNEPLKKLYGSSLEDFYDRCYKARSLFKKSTENGEGIFGAEELYDITSDVNFSTALENMKKKMEEFCKGADFETVWTGLTDYNIERTYMMAKNIAESNRLKDEYAYYNIGTNIITYTPGISGNEFLLMDLQKIKLKQPLEIIKNGIREQTKEDSDNDGILDRNELGDMTSESDNETATKIKVDITGFIKKAIEKELYGNDEKEINNNQAYIKEVVSKVKYNIYQQRNKFDKENSENNKWNWKEVYENNLNIDDDTKVALGLLPSDSAKEQYLKITPAKLEVELWKYKSNPVLKDTDFDGIEDGFGYERDEKGEYLYVGGNKVPVELNAYKDKTPKDNYFEGRMHTTRLSGENAIDVNMNMDYRYFFLSNKLYFDELSTMSLLYSNSIYRKGEDQSIHSGLQLKSGNNFTSGEERTRTIYKYDLIKNMNIDKFNNMQVKEMMEHFGFNDVRTYYMGERGDGTDDDPADGADKCMGYNDTHKGKVALGYKNIEYHGLYKTVIGIVIRGTAEDDDWDGDFDMGDKELRDAIEEYEYGLFKEKVQSGFEFKDENQKIINAYLNGENNEKYDHKYNTELTHFAYGYPDWKNDYHHAGFDIVSNRILELVKAYYEEVKNHFDDDIELLDDEENKYVDGGVCFWVTGHSMGAGVANLVASSLINGECGGNKDNVYCYTFAAPNTFYKPDNINVRKSYAILDEYVTEKYREPHGSRYRCIFNIVNDDDFVPKLPMEECEWTKYGRVAKLSIKNEIYNRFVDKVKIYDYQTAKYSNPTSNPSDARYPFDMIKMSYMNYVTKKYNTNLFAINTIISSFNSMFTDKTNMRNEAYRYVDNYVDYAENDNALEKGLGFYSKVYQKYNILNAEIMTRTSRKTKDNVSIPIKIKRQYQMPAFVMQNVANAVHAKVPEWKERNGIRVIEIRNQNEGIERNVGPFNIELKENEAVLFDVKFAKWGMFVSKWSMLIGEGKFKAIDYPHYLESYYTLSKEITTTDFR